LKTESELRALRISRGIIKCRVHRAKGGWFKKLPAMRISFVWISALLLGLVCGCVRESEFPSVTSRAHIPTGLLRKFDEAPLQLLAADGTNHVYRFVCNRTFHDSFCIVVRINSDGTGVLTKKMLGRRGGSDRVEIKEQGEVSLTARQVESLLTLLQQEQFWSIATDQPESEVGHDGSNWFVEGVRTNHYYIATRWTPKADVPVGRIGRHMIALAEWKIEDLY